MLTGRHFTPPDKTSGAGSLDASGRSPGVIWLPMAKITEPALLAECDSSIFVSYRFNGFFWVTYDFSLCFLVPHVSFKSVRSNLLTSQSVSTTSSL